jgi:hypothetical protein
VTNARSERLSQSTESEFCELPLQLIACPLAAAVSILACSATSTICTAAATVHLFGAFSG